MKLGKKQEKWLKALESGRYKQGQFKMCNAKTKEHCCLGVAARVMRRKFITHPNKPDRYLIDSFDYTLGEYRPMGLVSSSGEFDRELYDEELERYFPGNAGAVVVNLTELNDDLHATFKQIAHFIRENPERVFTKSV